MQPKRIAFKTNLAKNKVGSSLLLDPKTTRRHERQQTSVTQSVLLPEKDRSDKQEKLPSTSAATSRDYQNNPAVSAFHKKLARAERTPLSKHLQLKPIRQMSKSISEDANKDLDGKPSSVKERFSLKSLANRPMTSIRSSFGADAMKMFSISGLNQPKSIKNRPNKSLSQQNLGPDPPIAQPRLL